MKKILLALMLLALVPSARAFDWTLPRKTGGGGMAVDYGSGAAVTSSFGGAPWSVVVTSKAGGCASGDLVLIVLDFSTNSGCPTAAWAPALPTGFSLVTVASGNNPMTFAKFNGGQVNELVSHVAGAGEPSSYIFTQNTLPTGCSGSMQLDLDYGIACVSGVNATTPIESATELEGNCAFGTSCTVGTTSITTTKADMIVPAFYIPFLPTGWTSTVPGGYTSMWNYTDPPTNIMTNGSYLKQSAAGAANPSSVFSGSGSGGANNVAWLVAVKSP